MVWSARRWGRLSLAAGVVVATAIWLPPSSLAGPIAAGCAAAATGSHVAFVVDFGGVTASAGNVVQACVEVPSGDNDAEALAALSSQEGWPPPRYDQSGLLCAIDGSPASGCGTQTGDTYAYWSYWQGTADGWTYSNTGPAFTTASMTTAQGWRFEPSGSGSPSDPPPRGPPDPAATCGVVAPAPTAPVTAPSGSVSSATTAPPAAVTAATAAPAAPAVGTGRGGGRSSSASAAPSTSSGATTTRPGRGGTRATVPTTVAQVKPTASTTVARRPGVTPAAGPAVPVGALKALARSAGLRRQPGGSPWPALLTAGLLAVLAAGVVAHRHRHRAHEDEGG